MSLEIVQAIRSWIEVTDDGDMHDLHRFVIDHIGHHLGFDDVQDCVRALLVLSDDSSEERKTS